MRKPTKKKLSYYNYRECAEYVAKKLKVRNIDDFWHIVVELFGGGNGNIIQMFELDPEEHGEWEARIANTFFEHFGVDAEYILCW